MYSSISLLNGYIVFNKGLSLHFNSKIKFDVLIVTIFNEHFQWICCYEYCISINKYYQQVSSTNFESNIIPNWYLYNNSKFETSVCPHDCDSWFLRCFRRKPCVKERARAVKLPNCVSEMLQMKTNVLRIHQLNNGHYSVIRW